ncbi:MAG: DoxX family protein [Pseudomonas sp.]|uniref:HvfX family Cu-binding RiPP maturation protein n=1 Tax=Pseudomonas sp. TaxID=306 RepID=UPI0032423C9D
MLSILLPAQRPLDRTQTLDFLAPLLIRLYLAPIMWMAGTRKLAHIDSTISWFEHGLGLPFPEFLAWLATLTEVIGAVLLLIGLATRWISIPLMITMLVAAFAVHWPYGWPAIADPSSLFANDRVAASAEKLARAKALLQEHGNYNWLTSSGRLVILNNGIEFAATYFILLLSLFFTGGGRWVSVDYWLRRRFATD